MVSGQSAIRVGMASINAGISVAWLAEMSGIVVLNGSMFKHWLTSVAVNSFASGGGK